MGFLADFKAFATKGNLVDVAIGFLMGTAFSKLVGSFTEGLVSPILGILTGGKDFSKMTWTLKGAQLDASNNIVSEAITFKYGAFLTSTLDFIIVALVCYAFIKAVLRKDPNAVPPPTKSEQLLTEIRDSLKK
ncbi:large conductance mechanosensitive channel protein MscL [Flavihumibacter profundi]|uniref:large conductance mechanosensitive channel protein MscL n=1 Tax=Flavihumibacter profundi TaxID=2716883 RepID=UPI001CC4F220|nr:large conductance mechanosensitive channel protein MscL [Flavihumibacter profundi]MBZ5858529.1 large conductance mechanosensitive channel protein MscL [Flavihumibacter profundi]